MFGEAVIAALAASLLHVLVLLGVNVVSTVITPNSAVIVVDCAKDGAYAKAVEAARLAERKTGKTVGIRCATDEEKTVVTTAVTTSGVPENAP